MNRYFCFLLSSLLLLSAPAWSAAEIERLRAEIDAKAAERAALEQRLESLETAAQRQAVELEQLREDAEGVEKRRTEALAALQDAFERVVADPSLDLTEAQQDYRAAFDAVSAHRQAVAAKERQISDSKQSMADIRATVELAGQDLDGLQAGLARARAKRLFDELNVVGEITLSETVTCNQDETIGACIERGEGAARQLARERFAAQIFAAVTEADVVARNGSDSGLPTLIDSKVQSSGFRGQGDYFVELTARLRNETSEAEACKLLGLDQDQCSGKGTDAPEPNTPETGDTRDFASSKET